jgi:hypothetical protein
MIGNALVDHGISASGQSRHLYRPQRTAAQLPRPDVKSKEARFVERT